MKIYKDTQLPKTMTALLLRSYESDPVAEEVDTPAPGKGQVLVKMDSAPINPSDLMFLIGKYGSSKSLPVVPGFEGSGTVVAAGDDFLSRRLLGKQVTCFAPGDGNGSWAQYMVTGNRFVLPVKGQMDLEQAAMLLVNPLSAHAMVDIAVQGKHKAVANTAAASALGQMMNSMAIKRNLPLVNIVRRSEQVALLKSQGADVVLNSSDEDFTDRLKETFERLRVTMAFDAISGSSATGLLHALPKGGEVLVYGALEDEPIETGATDLIFRGKRLTGFWASEWIGSQSMLKMMNVFKQLQQHMTDVHNTRIHKRMPLSEATAAIELYKDNMTAGKVLFKPNAEPR